MPELHNQNYPHFWVYLRQQYPCMKKVVVQFLTIAFLNYQIFNTSIDALYGVEAINIEAENKIIYDNFKHGSNAIYPSGKISVFNPSSLYFTLEDINGDTLVFARTNEVIEGVMLISENLPQEGISHIPSMTNKKLFLSSFSYIARPSKQPLIIYTNSAGTKLILKNKSIFLYYGYLIARITHITKTEHFFS